MVKLQGSVVLAGNGRLHANNVLDATPNQNGRVTIISNLESPEDITYTISVDRRDETAVSPVFGYLRNDAVLIGSSPYDPGLASPMIPQLLAGPSGTGGILRYEYWNKDQVAGELAGIATPEHIEVVRLSGIFLGFDQIFLVNTDATVTAQDVMLEADGFAPLNVGDIPAGWAWSTTVPTAVPVASSWSEDTTPPAVVAISRVDANPTRQGTVHFDVAATERLSGMDSTDFSVRTTGSLWGTTVGSVVYLGVVDNKETYRVSVNIAGGEGSLGLDLLDDDTVLDGAGNPLGGPGTGNGAFAGGEVYALDMVPPSISCTDQATALLSPGLTGTVDDPTATVIIDVIGWQTGIPATNHGDGTWSIPAGILEGTHHGVFTVHATGTDTLGNSAVATGTLHITLRLLSFYPDGNGWVQGPTQQMVPLGDSSTPVLAVPNSDYVFRNWTSPSGFVSIDNPLQIAPAEEDMVVTANFSPLFNTDYAPSLVKDIYPGHAESPYYYNAENITPVGENLVFFTAANDDGIRLWRTDGTPRGTRMVTVGCSSLSALTDVDGVLFFIAQEGSSGTELWKSDGTTDGTVRVKDIWPGLGSSGPAYLTNVDGTIFFAANDGTSGIELWKSDGTEAGTVRVKDIRSGSGGSSPMYLTNVGGTLFFSADDGTSGRELWKSDGTEAGTVRVKDIRPGSSSSGPMYLANVDGTLFFRADDGTSGTELWKSDGTTDGTVRVKDIASGSGSSWPDNLTNVDGTLFFRAHDGTSGYELWKSDGTEVGTVRVKDIVPGSGSSSPGALTNIGGTLFFTANDGTSGSELWKSDGTEAGTVRVKDIRPGLSSSELAFLTNVGGTLFFRANDGTSGYELWKSDGTEAGTVRVKDIRPGSDSSWPDNLTSVGDTLFFRANDGTTSLWKSDGTEAGTVRVKDTFPGSGSSSPYYLTSVGGTLFFRADDGTSGYELWKSDGTEAGTVRVKDIFPGSDGSWPDNLTSVGGTLFFSANDGTSGSELWKSDGTEAGTVRIKDIYPGSNNSNPASLTNVGGTLFFTAYDVTGGYELWKSDGTEAGTVRIKDIYPGSNNSNPASLTNVGGTLFFTANDGTSGSELWKSDGTEAGTVRVKDIYLGSGSSNPSSLTNVDGTLFFRAYDGTSGYELWKSDGTDDGTVMVKDIRPGSGSSDPAYLTNVGGAIFFAANDGTSGIELWKSDGTANGTVRVKDIVSGSGSSWPQNLANVDGTLFFTAYDGTSGYELWKSDGTEAGTVRVKDIVPGLGSSSPAYLTNVDGALFFVALHPKHGSEIWRSDGTEEGTTLVGNIGPGAYGCGASQLTQVGNRLFFAAYDTTSYDRELWSITLYPILSAPSAPGAAAVGTDTITWTWQDNSEDEAGFSVWVDPGMSDPSTQQTVTGADTEEWTHTGLQANTPYSMQVAAVGERGTDSERSSLFTAWTLAQTPPGPVLAHPTRTTLEVALAGGDGNPADTAYAIQISSVAGGTAWVQTDGTLAPSPAWQTADQWGTTTVAGLTGSTEYTVSAKARNGAAAETPLGPGSVAATHCLVTFDALPGGVLVGGQPQQQTIPWGTDCSPVEARADTNYLFEGWSDGTTTGAVVVTNVTSDLIVTARFGLRLSQLDTFDPCFGLNGLARENAGHWQADSARGLALQDDGRIVTAGRSGDPSNPLGDFLLMRFETDGTLDPTFASGGALVLPVGGGGDAAAEDVAVQSNGRIVAVGRARKAMGVDVGAMVRILPDGALDADFGAGGVALFERGEGSDAFYAGKIQSYDQRLVAAGASWNGADFDMIVVRFNPDGTLDGTFGAGGVVQLALSDGDDLGYALAVQPNGRIVVAGQSKAGSRQVATIVRLTAGGLPDPTFGAGGVVRLEAGTDNSEVNGLAIQPNGRILGCGALGNDMLAFRLTGSGNLDPAFGPGGIVAPAVDGTRDGAAGIALRPDGQVLLAGFATLAGQRHFAVVCLEADGTPAGDFGTAGVVTSLLGAQEAEAHAIAVGDGMKIVVAGSAKTDDLDEDVALVQFQGAAWEVACGPEGTEAGRWQPVNDGSIISRAAGIRRIRLRCADAVDPASVDVDALTVTDDLGGVWPVTEATVSGDGRTIEFGCGPLPGGRRYTLAASVTIRDLNGVGITSLGTITLGMLAGDVNGDGQVDLDDLSAARVLTATVVSDSCLHADVNGDGRINVGDLMSIHANLGATLP